VRIPLDDLPPGGRASVEAFGRRVALFRVGSRVHAFADRCPHRGAALSCGTLTGTMLPSRTGEYVWGLEGRVLRCPWHGWEFDLEDGQSLFEPRARLHRYEAEVVGGEVVVRRPARA